MSLTCSYCHREAARTDCHRNRYGELICHACQKTGVKFTWRRRLRLAIKKTPLYLGIGLAIAAAVLLLSWLLHLLSLTEPLRLFN